MNTALKTFAWAIGSVAVFITCIAWLGLWGKLSLVRCILVWALWCGPALMMMACDDLRYRKLLNKIRADGRKSPNEGSETPLAALKD